MSINEFKNHPNFAILELFFSMACSYTDQATYRGTVLASTAAGWLTIAACEDREVCQQFKVPLGMHFMPNISLYTLSIIPKYMV